MTKSASEGRAPANEDWLRTGWIEQTVEAYLRAVGEVFAVFDEHTQDAGNISYGVRVGSERYVVKTAGWIEDPQPYLSHAQRVALLRNAAVLSMVCEHRALARFYRQIESPEGPLLVYE